MRKVVNNHLYAIPYKKIILSFFPTDHAERVYLFKWVLNKRINLKKYFICSDEAYFICKVDITSKTIEFMHRISRMWLLRSHFTTLKQLILCAFLGEIVWTLFLRFDCQLGKLSANAQGILLATISSKIQNDGSTRKTIFPARWCFSSSKKRGPRMAKIEVWGQIHRPRWPSRSLDLNPCDFSSWRGIKAKIYDPKPINLEKLKANNSRR